MGRPFCDQSGLEVLPNTTVSQQGPPSTGPEFAQWPDAQASTASPDAEKEVVVSSHGISGVRKLHLWIFAVILALLIVVGAVVGGVVGSRNLHLNKINENNNDGNNHNNSSQSPPADNSNPTTLKQKSTLAATGWRMGGTSNVQLFYQGQDNFVYYTGWDSGHHGWSIPTKLAIGAASDTPMAASLIFHQSAQEGHPPNPQVEFYYRNTSSYVSGENFQFVFPDGLTDSIEDCSFIMGDKSRLAAYWPVVVYQAKSSELEMIWYNPNTSSYDKSPHSLSSLSAIGSPNTPIVVLPLRALHPTGNHTAVAEMKLLYRRDDGKIYEFDRWANGTVSKNDALPGVSIGPEGSLAGFTSARANDDSGTLNTYALYQTDNGTIMYSVNTDTSGWQNPKADAVFEGADNPTSLACVTPAASTNPDIPLTAATELNRCYFQKNGKLIEVHYDGSKWNTLGEVPLLP